jgi:putative component of toxin-antitoxin plasmid stabilization module
MTSPHRRREIWRGPRLTLYAVVLGGVCDVEDWLAALDARAQAAFRARFEHLTQIGHLRSPEAWRFLGNGVYEIKVHTGPGYRLYMLRDGADWIATHGRRKPKDRKISAEVAQALHIYQRYSSGEGGAG